MKQNDKRKMIHPGRCMGCGDVFAKAAMSRHLKTCREKNEEKKTQGKGHSAFHLLVEGRYLPEYWLHLAVPVRLSLYDLDQFLRVVWLECCGHLSMFHIDGVNYTEDCEEIDYAESVDAYLDSVLAAGKKFHYEYDFGTTTHLALKVSGLTTVRKKAIEVLARNEPPSIPCAVCGKEAEQICAMCSHLEEGWLCSPCAKKHHCDNPVFLPVINSPRTGLCGYTGPIQ